MRLRIDIVTLFPEAIRSYLATSILGVAQKKGLVKIKLHNLRWFTSDRYRTVDDYPFGGGPGMVLKPEPIFRAVQFIKDFTESEPKVLITSPGGKILTQDKARELSQKKHLLIICGRYQGIDERVVELCQGEEISIGNYVLSGGELPALVITEATVRLIPGVLGDEESLCYDSFAEEDLLGPPQYTRPRIFRGIQVPEILTSGNHRLIEEWRREQAEEKTKKLRPELFGVVKKKEE
ncbi:MAG: tRNA (guanine37-N1)-methyltransferase [Candidatus Atribacteria bacterium]|nr:tRNA (guanine37-N1)-methyltransferase [Candidatus Atribacteria bacterium]